MRVAKSLNCTCVLAQQPAVSSWGRAPVLLAVTVRRCGCVPAGPHACMQCAAHDGEVMDGCDGVRVWMKQRMTDTWAGARIVLKHACSMPCSSCMQELVQGFASVHSSACLVSVTCAPRSAGSGAGLGPCPVPAHACMHACLFSRQRACRAAGARRHARGSSSAWRRSTRPRPRGASRPRASGFTTSRRARRPTWAASWSSSRAGCGGPTYCPPRLHFTVWLRADLTVEVRQAW